MNGSKISKYSHCFQLLCINAGNQLIVYLTVETSPISTSVALWPYEASIKDSPEIRIMHHSTIILRDLWGALRWDPLCRETTVCRTYFASFVDSFVSFFMSFFPVWFF